MKKVMDVRTMGPLSKLPTKVNAKLYEKYISKDNGKP